jgi:hypothetical protein
VEKTLEGLDLFQTLLLTLCGKLPRRTDAVFVHGSSVKDDTLDNAILRLGADIAQSLNKPLVINGTTQAVCSQRGMAYPGVEVWERTLNMLGVSPLSIGEALHTPAESTALIDLALRSGWQHITILGLPHHVLRCFAQMVYFLDQRQVALAVYPRTLSNVNWWMPAEKPVLDSDEVVTGRLFDHILAELKRLSDYSDKSGRDPVTGKVFTPNATLPEIIAYIKRRDGVIA